MYTYIARNVCHRQVHGQDFIMGNQDKQYIYEFQELVSAVD